MRIFKRTSEFVEGTSLRSSIKRYEYTRSRGLFVVFVGGFRCKSEYTLRDLLSPEMPAGHIVEVRA